MENYNLDIKRTFLSFAQALFAEHPRYTWDADPTITKVLIVDKHTMNLKVLEAKRSIILSRGTYGWRHTSLGQRAQMSGQTIAQQLVEGKRYSDLLRGSITFNCIAQNGLVAEDMAHILFAKMTGYKEQFRTNGIHQLTSISIGEETLLKTDSSVELTAVPVYVQFETQKALANGYEYYTLVLTDQNGIEYHQGASFYIDDSGIHFYNAPLSSHTFTATYTNAITLESLTEPLIGTVNGVNVDFSVSYPIYTAYNLFSGIQTTVSGLVWDQ